MATRQPQAATAAASLVVVSNRLPVDRVTGPDGVEAWRTSPGGLVTAMEAVVKDLGCAWVGWPGSVGEQLEPFQVGSMRLAPVALDEAEFTEYYEGFSNDTVWPLYHDVIAPPGYHREWWDRYVKVNRRFAEAAADAAEPGATVWVHDYHLQLVPEMLRELRPDVQIGFFLHIPFPAFGLFGQLPWRRQVLEGLLGADVVGFQRESDAVNFREAVRRFVGAPSNGNLVVLPATAEQPGGRRVLAQEFPISIDAEAFERLASSPDVQARARQIRVELGNPSRVILGVDRLDYTKGIAHRLKAFSELLRDGLVRADEVTLVQVASPSRERVEAYRLLRDEIEVTVGRVNGDHGSIGHSPVVYLHQGVPREEMAALYLAADVLVVTSLRDGMNLVAKEYAACRIDEQGVLVLSEFTGAADELQQALLINPHDTNGVKSAFLEALHMPVDEQRQRMRALRHTVFRHDVSRWSEDFLRAVEGQATQRELEQRARAGAAPATAPIFLPASIDPALRRLASEPELLVACDFDGTLAPIVEHPDLARILPRAEHALTVLQEAPGVTVAILSGRSLESLAATGLRFDGRVVAGSHGAELLGLSDTLGDVSASQLPDSREEAAMRGLFELIEPWVRATPGAWIEAKPFGYAVHVRLVSEPGRGQQLLTQLAKLVRDMRTEGPPVQVRGGKQVLEFSVREANKGEVLRRIRSATATAPVLFIGDDVTDEDALRALVQGDMGVRVGDAESVAEYRVRDPEEVAALLARLAALRTGTIIGTDSSRDAR